MNAAEPIRESALEHFFRQRVRMLGGMCVKLAPTERGIPDRLVMMPGGHMYLVELKTEEGTVSPIQQLWHQRAKKIGVEVHVLRGKGEILEWLRADRDSAYNRDPELATAATVPDVD